MDGQFGGLQLSKRRFTISKMGKGSQHQKVENRIVNLKTYHRLTVVGHEVFRSTNSLSALSMLGIKCDGTIYTGRKGKSEDVLIIRTYENVLHCT